MPWIDVTPKPRFLEWSGENLDEWQERWPNAEVADGNKLVYGPGIVAEVGDGMVEGGGLSVWLISAADLAAQFVIPAEGTT
ncbi:hypothetical protein [Amycolatopsis solani]|uniref:hypothetical protein n=1 Tax=Amycolatopsis solani TaxID=3028615 RepID=UPI0025AFD38F|nr:hypothetical protein [Amycolatopsis sp. MEP2-6]